MCKRQQIVAAHDIVAKIPDELHLTPEQVQAIAIVLGLFARLLDLDHFSPLK
jgi:hypothetical protein